MLASYKVRSEQFHAERAVSEIRYWQFPRVTVYLHPDDLEPTEELKNAIKRIQKTKDVSLIAC